MAEADVDVQAERIGSRIRRLRHARGLTLVQLAGLAELSHPFLSQLERGLARPSIASLEKISEALGSSQIELLADTADPEPAAEPISVVRSGEGAHGHYGEGTARMLVTGNRRLHPMEVSGDNREFPGLIAHAEDEFVHVLEGRIEVDLGPGGLFELDPDDSIYYVGGTPHRWRLIGGAGYRLFVVKERPARL